MNRSFRTSVAICRRLHLHAATDRIQWLPQWQLGTFTMACWAGHWEMVEWLKANGAPMFKNGKEAQAWIWHHRWYSLLNNSDDESRDADVEAKKAIMRVKYAMRHNTVIHPSVR